jgi:hypothetical protein
MYFKKSQKRQNSLRWILTNGPTVITVLGSAILAILASTFSLTTVQLLQAILALLALIGTSLLTERFIEGRELQLRLKAIDSQLNEVLDYARDIKAAGLDSLVKERRDLPPLEDRLEGAKCISILGGSLFRLANEYQSLFEKLSKEGCKLRFILTDPSSEAAIELSSTVVYEAIKADAYRSQIKSAIESLSQLVSKNPHNCELRLYSFAPPFSIMVIEKKTGSNIAQVEIYAFRVPARNRLTLVLDQSKDPKLYHFFSLQFDSIWNSEFSTSTINNLDDF